MLEKKVGELGISDQLLLWYRHSNADKLIVCGKESCVLDFDHPWHFVPAAARSQEMVHLLLQAVVVVLCCAAATALWHGCCLAFAAIASCCEVAGCCVISACCVRVCIRT